ncbi:MAG: GTPase ObgE, partial [Flavobacteriaceae bacterium]|nr:GTPase ObgE [Flavobacteriaceae bacterium]
MTEGNFVDYIKVYASSGSGGGGSVHLHREKYITKGGPDGGDGGNGGSIFLKADNDLNTLVDFRYIRTYKARQGDKGRMRCQTGAGGDDMYLKVPLGTRAFDLETDELIGELTEPGMTLLVA